MKKSILPMVFLGVAHVVSASAAEKQENCEQTSTHSLPPISAELEGNQVKYKPSKAISHDKGPHTLEIFAYHANAFTGTCHITIDAIDNKTEKRTNLIHSGPTSKDGMQNATVMPGAIYDAQLDGVDYRFKVSRCDSPSAGDYYNIFRHSGSAIALGINAIDLTAKLLSPKTDRPYQAPPSIMDLEIRTDFSGYKGKSCKADSGPVADLDHRSPVQIEWSGLKRSAWAERPGVFETVIGAPASVGLEKQDSREMGFSASKATGFSGTIGTGLNASIAHELSTNHEAKIEQGLTHTVSVQLDPKVCSHWRVDKLNRIELAHVTAPQFGITRETRLPIDVVVAQRLRPKHLCKDGSTVATADDIEAAERQIDRDVTEGRIPGEISKRNEPAKNEPPAEPTKMKFTPQAPLPNAPGLKL